MQRPAGYRWGVAPLPPARGPVTAGAWPRYRCGVAELVVPHAVLAALWLPYVSGEERPRLAALPKAVAAVSGKETHVVSGTGDGLAQLLGRWASRSPRHVAAVLPVPGRIAGLPAEAVGPGLEAGQCLLCGGKDWGTALVPHASTFGSALEPGVLVEWQEIPLADPHPALATLLGGLASVPEARGEVLEGIWQATSVLEQLDVADAAGMPEAFELLHAEVPGHVLPPGLEPRRVELLARAARLLGLSELSTSHEGAPRTASQGRERFAALQQVGEVARRGLVAASRTVLPDS